MSDIIPVGTFKFGGNLISADHEGLFTLNFVNGGVWSFDLGEVSKLDEILAEFEELGVPSDAGLERIFWRTNGSKVIQVGLPAKQNKIILTEGGATNAHFHFNEIPILRNNVRILTSHGSPYGRSVKLLDVVEEGRIEELIVRQDLPLNNRNSNSPLIVEREFARETTKTVHTGVNFGIGFNYFISIQLESHFGLTKEDKLTERVSVTMQAEPGELKIYTILWKDVWITGYAEFEMGDRREKVPFRLKSGLIPVIDQETLV